MSFLFIVRWNNVVDTVLNYVVFNGICDIDTIYTKSQNDFEIIKVIENDKKKMEKKQEEKKKKEEEKIQEKTKELGDYFY